MILVVITSAIDSLERLVSEMTKTTIQLQDQEQMIQDEDQDQVSQDQDLQKVVLNGLKTVSYTHLTLPTNREV